MAVWASASSLGSRDSCRRFPVVHNVRAGQGPQSLVAKVTTMASLPYWVHGVHDVACLPCGQVTVRVS
jgi:hypothetical protein